MITLQMKLFKLILLIPAINVAAEVWHLHNFTEYSVSDDAKNFDDAHSSCTSLQAELVMIQTEDVQVFLEGLFDNNAYSSGNE